MDRNAKGVTWNEVYSSKIPLIFVIGSSSLLVSIALQSLLPSFLSCVSYSLFWGWVLYALCVYGGFFGWLKNLVIEE